MRIQFKTSYNDDINLFEDGRTYFWYGLLIVIAIAMPFILDEYLLGELVAVVIWAIAGMGLMLLAGHTGQPSLGHGAFLACGAYMEAWLHNNGVFFFDIPAGFGIVCRGSWSTDRHTRTAHVRNLSGDRNARDGGYRGGRHHIAGALYRWH